MWIFSAFLAYIIMQTTIINTLPNELFKKIAGYLRTYDGSGNGKPIPTYQFFINKCLSAFLKVEQVRSLHFQSIKSLKLWLDMIQEDPSYFFNQGTETNSQSRHLLSCVENLKFEDCNNVVDPNEIYTKRLLVFIQNCTRLRSISIESKLGTFFGFRFQNLQQIVRSLSLTVQHIELLTDLTDASAVNALGVLVDEWLLGEHQLLSLKWRSGCAKKKEDWKEKLLKFFEHAPLVQKFDGVFPCFMDDFRPSFDNISSAVNDEMVAVALRYCPELCEFNFQEDGNVDNTTISEWFSNRGPRITVVELKDRWIDDEFIENMARNCPNIKKIDFNIVNGFSMRGVWAILDGCRVLEFLSFVDCNSLGHDPVWKNLSKELVNLYSTARNNSIVIEGHNINKLRDLICEQGKQN